ncbi:MAG TPA: ABC transporter permease [Candidatus Bathyarchaeia archaeon]|nr:ABC transporter permease [Candidatus Bathyarchaeia archaeon]
MSLSPTRTVALVIERDIRILFSDSFLVGIMFANFAIDLFVTAATYGGLVRTGYFLQIAPGSNFITAAVASFQSGRDVWREKYIKDLASYLLTLPVPRRLFAASRIISGVVRSLVATLPGTLVIAYLYGILFSPLLVVAFLIVGLFSLGIVGLSIAVSAFASSIEMFATLRSLIQLYLSFLSTIFFSVEIFPTFLRPIVLANPMTWAIEAFRALRGPAPTLYPVSVLIGPSLVLAAIGMLCYLWYARL